MPANILLVEDEPAIQELIAANLTRAGHHVVRAAELEIDPHCRSDVAAIDEDLRFGRWSALRAKITRFHRRRALLAGRVVAAIRPRESPLG